MNAKAIITTPDILLSEIDGEPRARDLDIAVKLGFDRARDIRKLIERNLVELEGFGTCAIVAHVVRGNPVKEYWLTEEQALLLASLSQTEKAAEVRAMLIRVFVAYRRGQLQPVSSPAKDPREGRLHFKQALSVAKLVGLSGFQAAVAANRATVQAVGYDMLGAMGVSYMPSPVNDTMVTPTKIGAELGGMSAIKVNHALQEMGFQEGDRDPKGRAYWRLTKAGIEAGGQLMDRDRSNGTGSVQQLMWPQSIVERVQEYLDQRDGA